MFYSQSCTYIITINFIFLKIFLIWTIFKAFTEFVIASVFCFGFLAAMHVGSLLPNQGSNPHPVRWKVKSQPLDHQGSPTAINTKNYPKRNCTSWPSPPLSPSAQLYHPTLGHLLIYSLPLYVYLTQKPSYKWNIKSFVTGFFYSAQCSQDSSRLYSYQNFISFCG